MSQIIGAARDIYCDHLLPLAHIGDQIWHRLSEYILDTPHIQHAQLLSLIISTYFPPWVPHFPEDFYSPVVALHSSLKESPQNKNNLSIFLRDKYGMRHILPYSLEMNRKIQVGLEKDRTSQNQI